jgi:hypothetical protein
MCYTSSSEPFRIYLFHVKWVPCHHCMAPPQVADEGDGLQIWRAAANVLNKQSRTVDKGWSSSLTIGRGANNSPQKKKKILRNVTKGLALGRIFR